MRNKYFKRNTEGLKKHEVYIEASIFDLISAFKTAIKEIPKEIFFQIVNDEFTVEDKIHDLLHLLVKKEKIALGELFASAKNKLEIVVTFLAILELIKVKEIAAVQEGLFEPILITRRENIFTSL